MALPKELRGLHAAVRHPDADIYDVAEAAHDWHDAGCPRLTEAEQRLINAAKDVKAVDCGTEALYRNAICRLYEAVAEVGNERMYEAVDEVSNERHTPAYMQGRGVDWDKIRDNANTWLRQIAPVSGYDIRNGIMAVLEEYDRQRFGRSE